jgi:hypothetical protein
MRLHRICIISGAFAVLAGCAAAPKPVVLTQIKIERVTVPAALLTCAAQPAPGNITLQSQLADYIIDLAAAGADCRDDVAAISRLQAQIEAQQPGHAECVAGDDRVRQPAELHQRGLHVADAGDLRDQGRGWRRLCQREG